MLFCLKDMFFRFVRTPVVYCDDFKYGKVFFKKCVNKKKILGDCFFLVKTRNNNRYWRGNFLHKKNILAIKKVFCRAFFHCTLFLSSVKYFKKTMKKISFITADDFGISRLTNDRILFLADSGKIDRVSIMVRGEMDDGEIFALLRSGVFLDIHLDTDDIRLKRKIREGSAGRVILFLQKYIQGKYHPKKMRLTWERQILDFKERFGRMPDGINAHQHIHFFPSFFRLSIRLAKLHAIPFIRFGRFSMKRIRFVSCVLDILRILCQRDFARSGLDTSDVLLSADWYADFGESAVKKYSEKKISVERVFHPERDEEWEHLLKKSW